jgi:hypothetical protein
LRGGLACCCRVELFTCAALLAELTDILGRRKFDKKIAASPGPSIRSWIAMRHWPR